MLLVTVSDGAIVQGCYSCCCFVGDVFVWLVGGEKIRVCVCGWVGGVGVGGCVYIHACVCVSGVCVLRTFVHKQGRSLGLPCLKA